MFYCIGRNNCQCGRDVQWHMDKGIPVNIGTHHNFWHPRDHTEVMPCDSFGEILFRGFGSQSYNSPVCVAFFCLSLSSSFSHFCMSVHVCLSACLCQCIFVIIFTLP